MKIEKKYFLFIVSLFLTTALKAQSNGGKLEIVAKTIDNSVLTQVVDIGFGNISENHLNLFVSDIFTPQLLTVLRKEDTLQFSASLGREGRGPGEFLEITDLQTLSENHILSFDGMLSRITILNTANGEVIETINLDSRKSSHKPFQLHKFSFEDSLIFAVGQQYFTDDYDLNDQRTEVLKAFNHEGTITKDSILIVPADDAFVFMRDGSMSVNPEPDWGEKSIFRFGNNHIYYVHTSSPTILQYDKAGNLERSINIDLPVLPLTSDDRKNLLERESLIMDMRKSKIRQDLFEKLPNTWPAIHDILVDEVGRFWVGLPAHVKDTSREWWILDEMGLISDKITLPSNFKVHEIKRNYIAGELFDFSNYNSTILLYNYN